jgi:DNA invertase Pin-like site-specific DNA recombinase
MPTRTVYRSAERKGAVRLTPTLYNEIRRQLAAGHSQNTIARSVGCSQHLVHKVASGKIADVGTVRHGAEPAPAEA